MGLASEHEHTVGGQAVIEGVMMRGKHAWGLAVRQPSGEIARHSFSLEPIGEKYPALKLPILRGFIMYLTAVIQTIIFDHNPIKMQIETDTEKWEQSVIYLVLGNGPREGGGFLLTPDAKIDDGILDYVMITDVSRLMMFRILPEAMKGTHGRFKQVKMGTCKKFTITADRPLYIHADGEIFTGPGTDLRKVSFEILPNALKVVRGS